jgi:hypothetical protein
VSITDPSLLFLAELVVWDPSLGTTRILRYASGVGFVTGAAETPASTWYDARIQQPATMRRDCFDLATTRGESRVGFGNLVLLNGDGALDALLDYSFDGWPITIRQGSPGAAYPSGFTTLLVGTMNQAEFNNNTVTISLRDRQQELRVPLQSAKYGGTNQLPNGLDGVDSDLKGKPKPFCCGQVQNIAPPCVNTSKLIYQVHDAAVNQIVSVCDRGIALGLTPFGWTFTSIVAASQFFALATNGSTLYAGGRLTGPNTPMIYSTTDGQSWGLMASPFTGTGQVSGIAYGKDVDGKGLFVAVTTGLEIAYLPEGSTTWVKVSGPAGATGTWTAVTYSTLLSLWIIVGDGGKIATAPDGARSWTSRTSGTANALGGVCAGPMIVAVGNAGTICASANGFDWTVQTVAAYPRTGVFYNADGGYVAGGGSASGNVIRSSDASAWVETSVVQPGSGRECTALCYAQGIWLASLFPVIGGTWTSFSLDGGASWHPTDTLLAVNALGTGVAVFNARFFVTAQNGAGAAGVVASSSGITYGTLAALLDDTQAPKPGGFGTYSGTEGSFFRLGSLPAGQITADVIEGSTTGDRTTAQIYKRLLVRAGKPSSDISNSDLVTLDRQAGGVIGYWTNQETTYFDLIDEVVSSVGAWWGIDRTGIFRIQQLQLPSGAPVQSYTANDLKRELNRVPSSDSDRGIPSYQCIVRYGQNFTVQDESSLAAGVGADRRAFLARQWREASAADQTVLQGHQLAGLLVEESLLYATGDAMAEAARRLEIRRLRRDRFELVLDLDATTVTLDLGQVIQLTHSRYSLSAGKLFRIIGIEPNAVDRTVALTVWGTAGSDPVTPTYSQLIGRSVPAMGRGPQIRRGPRFRRPPH